MPDNKTLFKRLDQNTKNKINKYVDLAIEFNATHNIFARSNKKEVFNKDILDCLPVLEHIYENKSVMDLGSGGGFPGMIIGISKPKNKIYLVESSRKKVYFLRNTINTLELNNIQVINNTLIQKNNLGSFDYITTRAFANIKKTLNITKNNIHKRSKYLLLKGKIEKIKDEIETTNTKQLSYEIIKLDGKNGERNLVIIKPNE